MTEDFKKLLLSSDSPTVEQGNVPTDEEIDAAAVGYPEPEASPTIELTPRPTPAPLVEPPLEAESAPVVDPTTEPASVAAEAPVEAQPTPEAEATPLVETPDYQKSRGQAIAAALATGADVAVPTLAAVPAFAGGFGVSGFMAAPTGPLALGVGFAGGLISAGAAYMITDKIQESILQTVAPESYAKWNQYLEQSKLDYPYSTAVGQVIPELATARPSISMLKDAASLSRQLISRTATDLTTSMGKARIANLANVAFGAGTQLAAETVRQATEEGNFDFARIAGMMVFGALMNKQTKLGKKFNALGGLNSNEVTTEPFITETDEEMGRLLSAILDEAAPPRPEGRPLPRLNEPPDVTENIGESVVLPDAKGGAAPAKPTDVVQGGEPSGVASGKKEAEAVLTPEQKQLKNQKEAAIQKQAETDERQLRAFAALIDERISGDISKRAKGTETLNLDILNATITRDPERALQALAIILKKELKVTPLTAEVRARDAVEWLTSNGYEERIAALTNAKKVTDDLNYQIIAARYMTEQAVEALRKAQQKAIATNNEEDLAAAISMFLEVKRVLKPAEGIRGNWGRMGHAFRHLPPEQRNLATISKLMKQQGIDDFKDLTKVKAQYVVDMIQKSLTGTDPKSFARLATMTFEDKVVGAAAEILTGSVMSFVDTGAVNLIGGVGEAALAPVNGTLSGAFRLITASIKKQIGKASQKDIDMALAEIKSSALYYKYVTKRFDTNMKMFWSTLKNSEINFSTSLLEDVRGGFPVDRGQRIRDPKTLGQKMASGFYGKGGQLRTQGFLSSETFGVDPNKNPFQAMLLDTFGEVIRLPHRFIVAADDLVKASNAYAAAHTKLYMEATEKGLSGDDLNKYISNRLEILLDNNNKLYSRDRVMAEVRKEVKSEGLEGNEAFVEITKRTDNRFNTEMGELGKFSERWVKQITAQEDMGVRLNGTNTYGKSFETWFRSHPVTRLMAGVLFIRTPINLLRLTGRYLPTPVLIDMVTDIKIGGNQPFRGLKNLQKEYYESFMSGDEFRISQARGRLITGTIMTAAAWYASVNGIISGNLSPDKETRKLQLSRGEIPYAFKIKKGSAVAAEVEEELKNNPNAPKPDSETSEYYWFEYKRIHEPLASIFMVMADLTQNLKNPNYEERSAMDIFGVTAMVVGSQLKEKVFLNNFKQWNDLFTGISEDKKGIGRQISMYLGRRTAPVLTPILESTDPFVYELNSYNQFLARRMPEPLRNLAFGEDMYLPKAYNLFGENIEAAITGIAPIDFFNPFYVSTSESDPLLEEMIGFNYAFSSPERISGTEGNGKTWDIRDFVYRGETEFSTESTGEIVVLSETKESGNLVDKKQAKLLKIYKDYGITKFPKTNQDAYDRWQENIGQIKLGGLTVRERCERERTSPRYQALENSIFSGEENPRVKRMMGIISKYRSMALELTKEEYPDLKKAIATKKITNMALKQGIQREEINKKVPTAIDKLMRNFTD